MPTNGLPVPPLDASPPSGVVERAVQAQDGTQDTILILDASRKTFGAGLTYVFGRNVARARAENERLIGNPDGQLPLA